MKETTHCVRCLTRKAVMYSGYVQKPGVRDGVLAGWCRRCWNHHKRTRVFAGHWRTDMGIRKSES